jgi:hypothetical protein
MPEDIPPKRRGRPTKWKDEYCDLLVEHLAEGLSFDSFAGKIGITNETLNAWLKEKPEFSEAKKEGLPQSLLFWETMGRDGCRGFIKDFNTGAWVFNMKNRFGWRDKRELNHKVEKSLHEEILDAIEGAEDA